MPLTLVNGNSLEVLAGLPSNSIEVCVTDPPYGLADLSTKKIVRAMSEWTTGDRAWVPEDGNGFMGRRWDKFVPPPALWDEVFRVLKPGGIALVFAGSRTFDLMGISCRLAGFEVRDSVAWIQAQSMPKTSDLGKVTGEAAWKGWSTGLKSCNEPFLVLRKPFKGPMKAHVLEHGTGAYNIDATRVGFASEEDKEAAKPQGRATSSVANPQMGRVAGNQERAEFIPVEAVGRWTPNVVFSHHPACRQVGTATVRTDSHHPAARGAGGISVNGHSGQSGLVERKSGSEEVVPVSECHPDCPVKALDDQSGILTSGANPTRRNGPVFPGLYGTFVGDGSSTPYRGADAGGASRFYPAFYYCAKAPGSERPVVDGEVFVTVKPLDLMRWMVRLVGVPGGTIIDPFGGSGTTAEACHLEGFDCLMIEREREHIPFIMERMSRHPDALIEFIDANEHEEADLLLAGLEA